MSRIAGIPHASVCGGRGRCSTCRVRIGGGTRAAAEPPRPRRAAVLRARRRRAQRPAGLPAPAAARRLSVTPLLPPSAAPVEACRRRPQAQGGEREIAILFADIRGFTAHRRGQAALRRGVPAQPLFRGDRPARSRRQAAGVDKFIGDGVMALFGIDERRREVGCRQALAAARRMARRARRPQRGAAGDLDAPLRIGIGIHSGPAIVGEMGYERATAHRDRRRREHRQPARDADQGIRRRAGRVRGADRPRRHRSRGL